MAFNINTRTGVHQRVRKHIRRVMAQICVRLVTRVNCHTCECVMSRMNESRHTSEWVLSHVWKCHQLGINWFLPCVGTNHVIYLKIQCTSSSKTCHTCEWSHKSICPGTYERVVSCTWEPCHMFEWVIDTTLTDPCRVYERVMSHIRRTTWHIWSSHIWVSHVTVITQLSNDHHAYLRVKSYMSESCHTFERVTSHICMMNRRSMHRSLQSIQHTYIKWERWR